ncbi:MAG: hypothetical protein AB7W59_19315 [Acidimicrobiia bacterium]
MRPDRVPAGRSRRPSSTPDLADHEDPAAERLEPAGPAVPGAGRAGPAGALSALLAAPANARTGAASSRATGRPHLGRGPAAGGAARPIRLERGGSVLRAGTVQRDPGPDGSVPDIGDSAAWLTLEKADAATVSAVATAMATLEKATGRDSAVAAAGKAEAEAKAVADAQALLQVNKSLVEAIKACVSASVKADASTTLTGVLQGNHGPVSAKLTGVLQAWASASASLSAEVVAGIDGIVASASASVGVKAGVDASATAELAFGAAEAAAVFEASALAEASAAADAKFELSLNGIAVGASAEALAGVSAAASAGGSISLYGATIISAKGTIEVSAGVGFKAGGTFEFKNGVLTISGELAATLGLGGGFGLEVTVDFKALAQAIELAVVDAFTDKQAQLAEDEVPLLSDYDGMDGGGDMAPYLTAITAGFQGYADKKAAQGKHHVKQDKVQKLIDATYAKAAAAGVDLAALDAAITEAGEEIFDGQVDGFEVSGGKIKGFISIMKAK